MLFRHSRRGWAREATLEEHHVFRSVATRGTRTVVLKAPPALLYPAVPKLFDVAAGGLVPGPTLSSAPSPCHVAVVPHHLVLDGKGRLFVFGRRCVPDPSTGGFQQGAPIVEWFARGKRRSTLAELPPADGNPDAYEHASVLEEDVQRIVFSSSGTGRRLSFDGTSFALGEEQGPRLWRLVTTASGTYWGVTTDNAVVRSRPGEGWNDVQLPEKPAPCEERDCSMPIASIGDDVYLAINSTLYQLHGAARSPVPKHELSSGP
jgi:hypothetical protein